MRIRLSRIRINVKHICIFISSGSRFIPSIFYGIQERIKCILLIKFIHNAVLLLVHLTVKEFHQTGLITYNMFLNIRTFPLEQVPFAVPVGHAYNRFVALGFTWRARDTGYFFFDYFIPKIRVDIGSIPLTAVIFYLLF